MVPSYWDFCNELMLGIEIDGDSHNPRKNYDQRCQKHLESMGISFLRFDGFQVINNIVGVLQIIYDWIESCEQTHP